MARYFRPDITVSRGPRLPMSDFRYTGQPLSTRVLTGRQLMARRAAPGPSVARADVAPDLGDVADTVLGGGAEVSDAVPRPTPRGVPGGGRRRATPPPIEGPTEPSDLQEALGTAKRVVGGLRDAKNLVDFAADAFAPTAGTRGDEAAFQEYRAGERADFRAPGFADLGPVPLPSNFGLPDFTTYTPPPSDFVTAAPGAAEATGAPFNLADVGDFANQALPYLGTALSIGQTAASDLPDAQKAAYSVVDVAGTALAPYTFGISAVAAPFVKALIGKASGDPRTAKQKQQQTAKFPADLSKQMVVDLQEATTPDEFNAVLTQYASGQHPATFRTVQNGQNAALTLDDILADPDAFNVGIEDVNMGDYGAGIADPLRQMVLYNAQVIRAAQQGNPQAQAILEQRKAQNARYRAGIAAFGNELPVTQEMLRSVYLNAIGDNAFPNTDRAGALQRIAESQVGDPTTTRAAAAVLQALGVKTPGLEHAVSAGEAFRGDLQSPGGLAALKRYGTAQAAIPFTRSGGVNYAGTYFPNERPMDQGAAEALIRSWEDYLAHGSA